MKSFVAYFVSIIFLFFTFSCSQIQTIQTQEWMKKNGKLKILSTTEMINDLVVSIGGDHVDCLTLIFGGLDPHSYELVKGDDEKFSNADIVFANGLGLEHGACLVSTIQSHLNSVAVGDEIIKMQPDQVLMVDGAMDPHIWMDMSLWVNAIDPIVSKLSELDPKHQKDYIANAKRLREKIILVHNEILGNIQSIPSNKRYLVTSHDAFHYFARAYLAEKGDKTNWKKRFNAPEGLAPDNQMSSVNIANIIDHLKEFNINILFPESNVSQGSIRKIILAGKEMNLDLKISDDDLFGDSMDVDESIKGENYINMMKHNARVICRHLKAN